MSELIRVIDLSEWTGPVPVENARCMRERYNVRGAILQAWGGGGVPGRRNEYFHQAVDSFRQVGITDIDPYIWPPRDWRAALDWIGDYKRFMAGAAYMDVEAGAGVDDGIINGVRQAGWEPRIYASPNSWSTIMGNTTRYSDLKLWLARYLLRFQRPDGFYVPGFDVVFPRDAFGGSRVGGWGIEDLVGWQTTGTVPDFCNESIDSSIFYLSAFGQEEGDMAEDTVLRGIVGDLKKVVERQGENIEALQGVVKDIKVRLQNNGVEIDTLLGVEIDTLLGQAHEHDGQPDDWQGALDSHSADPDAHHE